MEAEGIAALFLPVSADLEYLSGVERQIPFFGQSSYAHGWASGALFVPGAEPVFVFPRMFVTFDLRERPDGELVVVNETDDGESLFARAMSAIPPSGKVAVGDRIWGEALLHLGRVVGFDRLVTGSRLVNDLRRVKDANELAAMGRAIAAASSRRWLRSRRSSGRRDRRPLAEPRLRRRREPARSGCLSALRSARNRPSCRR
jgi:Xaa-Pro aminopeptidase